MDLDQNDNTSVLPNLEGESRSAVNSLILDYYKKFGRKRDLEQYFSLSTAQSDIRDPSSSFWARMKTDNESSDSGDRSDNKKSESSQEVCRISIRFPAHDPSTSQEEDTKIKTESVSPPIIIEELQEDSRHNSDNEAMKSDDDAVKSDDNNSQKSYDVLLDTSLNKLHSPSSSITSQRKLEWDSLADVGYANESDRKTSASSLSTLERLALKQQYSNNDTQNSNLGVPTAHSTPLDDNESKGKNKKGVGKKSTKIYNKGVDLVEVNVPHSSKMNPAQSINVNLTKHISFNVEKDGKITIDNVLKDISVSPEKKAIDAEVSPKMKMDRDVQTSLTRDANVLSNIQGNVQQKIPILISLNTLKSRVRRRRLRLARRKQKNKTRANKENIPVLEKSGEQLSEAESFEYMPGHIYNQNQMTASIRPSNPVDNKSSLESSGVLTSDSSKGSKHSFTKDLEKSIDLLKTALQERCDDSSLRKKLIQQVCQRLLSSKYRDDDSTTDFLSGLSFSSKRLGLGPAKNNSTTSTSDANNSTEKSKKPKKSILRTDKFNPGSIASTSQSVPNLPVASNSENLVSSNLAKHFSTSNTESDMSSKEKTSSDNGVTKTSSEELYKKYLQALKREEAYKKHLKDKEIFLKQKLVSSDGAFKVPVRVEVKPSQSNNKLKDLIHDLTRNNYDDGSGDASKLEGGPSSHRDLNRYLDNRNQSHSVFTLSSGTDGQNKKPNLKKKLLCDTKELSKPGPSKQTHYCCCPHHGNLKFADSSVQVNIKNSCNEQTCPAMKNNIERQNLGTSKLAKIIAEQGTGNLQYVCLCSKKTIEEAPDDFLIYKCSRLNNKGIQLQETSSNDAFVQCNNDTCPIRNIEDIPSKQYPQNKSSQTDMLIKMMNDQSGNQFVYSSDQKSHESRIDVQPEKSTVSVYESTRWIQTEISIDPKIAEPTLSDINIVSDHNCAKLVSEQCRQVSKPSLSDVFSTQAAASSATALSSSSKSTGSSKDMGMNLNYYMATTSDKNSIASNPYTKIDNSEKFTIPIHGTNMTLMVSLGSEPTGNLNKNAKEMVTEGVGTEKVSAIEQATSVLEECSKGVQSDNTTFIKTTDVNSNNIKDDNANKGNGASKKPLTVNTCLTNKDIQFGTYPKTSPVNEQKPFRRANTDTDKVQNITIFRNVELGEDLVQSSKNSIQSNKILRTTSPDKSLESLKDRQDDHIKEIATQVDSRLGYEDIAEKCLCGCGGVKNNCQKDCPMINLGFNPREQFCKLTSDRQAQSPRKMSNEQCDKVSGVKNKWKESCKKLLTRKECRTQPSVQTLAQINEYLTQPDQTSSQLNNSLDKNNFCICGCGGTKDKCKIDCPERKLTLRGENFEKIKQSLDKQIETQSNIAQTSSTKTCTIQSKKNLCRQLPVDIQTDTSMIEELQSSPRIDKVENKMYGQKRSIDKQINTQSDNSPRQEDQYKNTQSDNSPRQEDQYKKLNINNEIETQTDTALIEGKLERSEKQPFHKKINSQTNALQLTEYEKCTCGCAGPKEICSKSCKELHSQPWDDNVKDKKQSFDKHIDTQGSKENCLCGCGGIKDNCQSDCVEINLTARGQCGRQDIPFDAQQEFLDSHKKSPREFVKQKYRKEVGIQKDQESPPTSSRSQKSEESQRINRGAGKAKYYEKPLMIYDSSGDQSDVKSSDKGQKSTIETEHTDSDPDPILNLIQNITKKYTKKDIEKNKRKKCFKEIITVLNYLLETDELNEGKSDLRNLRKSTTTADENDSRSIKPTEKESTDNVPKKVVDKDACSKKPAEKEYTDKVPKKVMDKGVQLSSKKSKANLCVIESSEVLTSTDTNIAETSSDSATCKVLNKIKKECERYQKRCKLHSGKNCEPSSSTSVNCDQCRRVHHCQCRNHKCKNHKKSTDKISKTPIAYNLILQTSESMMSDGPPSCEKGRKLKSIIVKVPKKKPPQCMPFREIAAKFERQIPCDMHCGAQKDVKFSRSRSLPNESEISSMEEIIRKSQGATVREYLEKNRPDFIEKCAQRQTCMRYISETRANERAAKRDLLSLHLAQLPDVSELEPGELSRLASELGRYMRHKKPAPKLISEREMKKRSEKIYKSLPEVVQKKEELKKENIKKTNLLMANMFKRNLQKKTLRGSVNISNYSSVIKI